MKQIILFMLAVLLYLPANSQKRDELFKSLTDKYASQEGFSASLITSDMFDLYLKKRNIDEESPVFEALKKLDRVMVISQSQVPFKEKENQKDGSSQKLNDLHSSFLGHYKSKGFTLLKTEKRLGEDVKVYLLKNSNKIESLALITNSSVSTNLVELKGDIDLKTVSELSQALNLRGLENLYKIDNGSSAFYSKHYFSDERIEALKARQMEMYEKQRHFSEEKRMQIEKQAQLQAQKQLEMAEKHRELAEKYKRQPIFLTYPGDTNTVYYLDGKKVKAKEIKGLDRENIRAISVNTDEKKNNKTTVRIKTK